MPLKVMTKDLRQRIASRALNFGPPNSWKTTSLIKTATYPLQVISAPGETGWATMPADVPGLTSYVWEEPPSDPVTADSMRNEIEKLTFEIIAGKRGPCKTLAIEGFHKLYDVYLNVATAGSFGRGDDFEAQRYGRAHQMAMSFLRRVLSSQVDYVIVTTWNAREADTPGSKSMHEYPDLPGRMAKLIVGMFSVVVYSKVTPPIGPNAEPKGEWILKPDSEVWGSSIKMDPRLYANLPARVPQDWQALYKLLGLAEEKVKEEEKAATPKAAEKGK